MIELVCKPRAVIHKANKITVINIVFHVQKQLKNNLICCLIYLDILKVLKRVLANIILLIKAKWYIKTLLNIGNSK